MKIDLSAIWIALLAVSPGLFALRARDLLVPRAFRSKGASEELAEFVTLSLATHIVFCTLLFLLCGFVTKLRGLGFTWELGWVDHGSASRWTATHRAETALLLAAYLIASFAVSHWLGVLYGAYGQKVKLTRRFLESRPLQALHLTGKLAETALIYDLLTSEGASGGDLVFVEAELKNGAGFYSGQVYKLAIVRDEEAHRPIYLIDAYFRADQQSDYMQTAGDGVLLDLGDVIVLHVSRQREMVASSRRRTRHLPGLQWFRAAWAALTSKGEDQ